MTLGEIIHALDKPSLAVVCQAALFYFEKFENTKSATVGEIKDALKKASRRSEAKANLSHALGNASPYVQIAGLDGRSHRWSLTASGRKNIAGLLPAIQPSEPVHEAGSLRDLVESLDADQAAYVEEAIKCLEADALHAAIVFLWAGAVREIQERVVTSSNKKIDASVKKRDPKAPTVRKVDHLCYVKESTLLLIAEDLSIFDRNERDMLGGCLKVRNKCGHPGKYKPGPKKVASFIEDVASIVFDS
ncbi:MAG: hypothetical protein KAS72_09030 [Phycisphaerales bacterium]|nr:hypothetical protein [Phycisphaerales bacterium]